MTQKAPGKAHREGISIMELADMFPDEASARKWFEGHRWPAGRHCPRCGSTRTHEASHAKSPYRCTDCRKYFSAKTGTALESSKIPLRKWVFAIYLEVTSLKGVSSMKLHRDLRVTQKTAWFMLHRLRESWAEEKAQKFDGPLEVDETFIGGRERNKHGSKKLRAGRGTVGKTTVTGARDRATGQVSARVVANTDRKTLHGFVAEHAVPGATVYTDDHAAYRGMAYKHEAVRHSVSEYVRGQAHTNGIESFWATLKRAYHGTFHHISPKHLQRYVDEFAGKHGIRDRHTILQMQSVVAGMVGKRLLYRRLVS